MEQTKPAAPAAASRQRRASGEQRRARRRRRRVRLARNWALFIAACAAVIFAVVCAARWAAPKIGALLAPRRSFSAAEYDAAGCEFDKYDKRLTLVNKNIPLEAEPSPALAVADDSTGVPLEAEAAAAYREMAAAALAEGIELRLVCGYMDEDTRKASFDERVRVYTAQGIDEAAAASRASEITPRAECSEYALGYAADILSADYGDTDTGFAETEAFSWLCAYAAEYGFILRCPEGRQAATGMVYEPWHWRYVGAENALAVRASGLSLEEFIALEQVN